MKKPKQKPLSVVGVGASAGGLEAFTQLLNHLPTDTGMAFVLVQHLDPDHDSKLTDLLARKTTMPVEEVTEAMTVVANHVYVIAPNYGMTIEDGVLKVTKRKSRDGAARQIDHFFESLAADCGARSVGVVLSGTASDGTMGLEAIKAEDGITFAQDESAKYDSMPRNAVSAGCVDFVLSPAGIAAELERIASHPHIAAGNGSAVPHSQQGDDDPDASSQDRAATDEPLARASADDGNIKKILLLVRHHSGVDFSLYKFSTVQRRIGRRMVLTKQDSLADYAAFLKQHANEKEALYADLLINVTSFFRNPEAFEALKREVFHPLVKQRGRNDVLRVWVAGCASGQEAYSIAIAFDECCRDIVDAPRLQVFATDLNDTLLEKARRGLYPKTLAQDLSPERLHRFFDEEEGGYRIGKTVRDRVVFARHNVLSDPPFSRMDLISCRNLLIYLEAQLQQKLIPAFHYALKPDGYLFLGASESTGRFTELFETVDKKRKIFSRRSASTPAFRLPLPSTHATNKQHDQAGAPTMPDASNEARIELDAQREADRVMVHKFGPPGVLIDTAGQVLQFRGATGAYLEPPRGRASFDVLKMAREGLMLPLRHALKEAKDKQKTVTREDVRIKHEEKERSVTLQVIPIKNLKHHCYLILFEEPQTGSAPKAARPASTPKRTRHSAGEDTDRVAELERELAETREYLESTLEQHEAANEELQASNEEVQSSNEELQSINEELETSKEELESANEELTTLNEEMVNRNDELARLNADLNNLQSSMQTAIVLLSRGLKIRRFTTAAGKVLDLHAADVGRSIGEVRHNFDLPDFDRLLREVIDTVSVRQREVQAEDGHWYSLRARPYMTLDNKVDGVVLMLIDIHALKQSEHEIKHTRDYAQAILATAREPLLVLRSDLKVDTANAAFYRLFRAMPEHTEGRLIYELGNHQWDIPGLRQLLEEILPENTHFEGYEVEHEFPVIGERTMLLNARQVERGSEESELILLGIQDVTERKRAHDALAEANLNKDEFLGTLAHELRNPLAPISNALAVLGMAEHSPDRINELRGVMQRQVKQITRLIDDLMDISRISRGQFELRTERVDLRSLVETALETARPGIDKAKQTLEVEQASEPLMLKADPARVTQAITNLLNNASKYSHPNSGKISLSTERDGDEAVLRVSDNGLGLPPDKLTEIFRIFTQLDPSALLGREGLGVGLALVKQLIEMHGGQVEAQSAGLDRGSTFTMRLPLVRGADKKPASKRKAKAAAAVDGSYRVLVAEDNASVAQMLAMLLEEMGHTVQTCGSGRAALDSALNGTVDVVISDLSMPGMDGYELARCLRENPQTRDLYLVALSGFGRPADKTRSLKAGFDNYLVKPPEIEDLQTVFSAYAARSSA